MFSHYKSENILFICDSNNNATYIPSNREPRKHEKKSNQCVLWSKSRKIVHNGHDTVPNL